MQSLTLSPNEIAAPNTNVAIRANMLAPDGRLATFVTKGAP